MRELQEGMANLVNEARRVLPKAFESEDYATKKDAAIRTVEDARAESNTQKSGLPSF